jgi:membrane protein YdbS with pleckstrin-like domain
MSEQHIFTNNQLDISLLPSVDDVAYHPLETSYRTLQLLVSMPALFVLMVASVIAVWQLGAPQWTFFTALGFWTLVAILQAIAIFKGFPCKGYALRERDIVYKKGWLYKQHVTIPFSRIQHVDIKEGILERAFEISRLNIYTAGGQSSDLTIPGLKPEDSRRLRSYIVRITTSDEEE